MKKNSKITLWLMLGAFAVCFLVRAYQIAVCTDMTTGFLYHDNSIVQNLMYYALVAFALALAAVSAHFDVKRRGGGFDTAQVVDARAAVIGFALLLVAICSLYEGYTEMSVISPNAFLIFIDLAFGAAMAVIAFVTLYKKEFGAGLGFSYSVVGLYFTLRGICVFLDHMVINSVPEYLIECLCVIGGAVFFTLLAKLFSGNGGRYTSAALCVWGVPTAVMTLSSALATIVCGAAAPEEIAERITASSYTAELYYQANYGSGAYMMTYTPWVNVAMGVFVAAALVVLLLPNRKPAQADALDFEQPVPTASEQPSPAED